MYMLTHISCTPGTILFFTGAVLVTGTMISAVIAAATSAKRKKKIQEHMKEKY